MKACQSTGIHIRIVRAGAAAKLGLGVLCLALSLTPQPVQAQQPLCLGQAAATLQPRPETIRAGYEITDGRIKHRDYSTAALVFRGAVFNTTGTSAVPWTHLSALYVDPDGRGVGAGESIDEPGRNDSRVLVALKYLDASGAPPRDVVVLDSNKERAAEPYSVRETRQMRVPIEDHKLNFDRNYYYVEVTLTRNGRRHSPEILGFKLCRQLP